MIGQTKHDKLEHATAGEPTNAVRSAHGRMTTVMNDHGTGFTTSPQNDGMGLNNMYSKASDPFTTVQMVSMLGRTSSVSEECPEVD